MRRAALNTTFTMTAQHFTRRRLGGAPSPGAMFLSASNDVGQRVAAAIDRASRSTGTDFDYLLKTAKRESSLDPRAKAQTSSAAGLFQFVESTWLAVMKEDGAKHGLGDLAGRIERTESGYAVRDPALRKQILDLRYDAQTAAVLAGELTRKNREGLKQSFGRDPTQGELYVAHFFGASDAVRLVGLAARTPEAAVAPLFPSQAAANRPIFYDEAGRARGAGEVYARLTAQHGTAVAAAPPAEPEAVPEGPFAWRRRGDAPVFHGLFTAFDRRPVGNYVQAAWSFFDGPGARAAPMPSAPRAEAATAPAQSGVPLLQPKPAQPEPGRRATAPPLNLLPYARPPTAGAQAGIPLKLT